MRHTLRLTHTDGAGTWLAERGLHLLWQLYAAPLNVLRPCLNPSKTLGDTGKDLTDLEVRVIPRDLLGGNRYLALYQRRVGCSMQLKNHNQSRNKHFSRGRSITLS